MRYLANMFHNLFFNITVKKTKKSMMIHLFIIIFIDTFYIRKKKSKLKKYDNVKQEHIELHYTN